MSSVAIAIPMDDVAATKQECVIPVGTMRSVEHLAPTRARRFSLADHGSVAAWTLAFRDSRFLVLRTGDGGVASGAAICKSSRH